MIRTRTWAIAGVVLGSALAAGTILAQGTSPTASNSAGAASAEQPQSRIYEPVSLDTLGTGSSAALLKGHFLKVADVFQNEVTKDDWPADAARVGFTWQKYYAFRTQPDGSDLICFVSLDNPDVAALKTVNVASGTGIFIMGRVGPRMVINEGGATSFEVDRVVLGHEEPKPQPTEKKPVILTIDRFGPNGIPEKQEFKIPKPGVKYRIPDPADPTNESKAIYVTLQF